MIPVARPLIGPEEIGAVTRVLESGNLAQGQEVMDFEREFSQEVVGSVPCVAVNSGTSALHLSLLAAGIGYGDEVIVPSFTFAATANAVKLVGAEPIFVDIESDFFCLSSSAVEAAITSRTRAIMPVHLYGQPADLIRLKELCDKHDLLLFEDAAQAHAAELWGMPVGSFGTAAAFSLYPTKNMTSGEGGMVASSSEELLRRVRLLRNQGQEIRYANEIVGLNNRMSDVHAAIGRVQLRKLSIWTERRIANAQFYDAELKGVTTPRVREGARHVYHQYTILVSDQDRDRFLMELNRKGVGAGIYYPVPVHQLPAFGSDQDLPITQIASKQCLSIPVHPALSAEELEKIVLAVNSVAQAGT